MVFPRLGVSYNWLFASAEPQHVSEHVPAMVCFYPSGQEVSIFCREAYLGTAGAGCHHTDVMTPGGYAGDSQSSFRGMLVFKRKALSHVHSLPQSYVSDFCFPFTLVHSPITPRLMSFLRAESPSGFALHFRDPQVASTWNVPLPFPSLSSRFILLHYLPRGCFNPGKPCWVKYIP